MVMIVMILVSSTVSAVSSMNKMVRNLDTHFQNGSGDNLSIQNDLMDKCEIATNLVSLSKDYISTSDQHIKAVQSTVNDLKSETSVARKYKLMNTLDTNVDWIMTELGSKGLSETHKNMLVKYQSQYRSENNTINSDPYNAMVKAYYDETSGFPGSLFRMFAKKAEYFQ